MIKLINTTSTQILINMAICQQHKSRMCVQTLTCLSETGQCTRKLNMHYSFAHDLNLLKTTVHLFCCMGMGPNLIYWDKISRHISATVSLLKAVCSEQCAPCVRNYGNYKATYVGIFYHSCLLTDGEMTKYEQLIWSFCKTITQHWTLNTKLIQYKTESCTLTQYLQFQQWLWVIMQYPTGVDRSRYGSNKQMLKYSLKVMKFQKDIMETILWY